MAFDASDPRAALASFASSAPVPTAFVGAELGLFYAEPPQEDDANGRTWYTRGQNFVVVHSEAKPGANFARTTPDEYCVIVPDPGTPVEIEAGGGTASCDGYALIVVPPGEGRLVLPKGGRITRLFSAQSPDLNAKCANAESYASQHPNLPPFEPWPAPKDGYRIRVYSLDVPPEPGRFGRIWRCTTMMVNYLDPQMGPRDVTKLSPHHHDDFEQCSLALDGSFIHHLRWPWTVDMRVWREDEHPHVKSPSVTVIPPPAIHTTRGMEPGLNQLVDIFSPPRRDFSEKGWVLNADEYPMPA